MSDCPICGREAASSNHTYCSSCSAGVSVAQASRNELLRSDNKYGELYKSLSEESQVMIAAWCAGIVQELTLIRQRRYGQESHTRMGVRGAFELICEMWIFQDVTP